MPPKRPSAQSAQEKTLKRPAAKRAMNDVALRAAKPADKADKI